MKRLLAVMIVALLFGVPLLVVLEWRLSATLLTAWLGVLAIAVGAVKTFDIVHQLNELEVDNRAMRQRLTVARTLVEVAHCDTFADAEVRSWNALRDSWLRDEDADPHVVAMRERVARLKAQRELDAIRS